MKHWEITDPGLVRADNQDAYGFAELPGGYTLAVVCDGMGGVAGGRVASTVAVEAYQQSLCAALHGAMSLPQLQQASGQAVSDANDAIRRRAEEEPGLQHMGTTLVSALVRGEQVLISNVGDSRAYLAGEEGLRQISRDHSLVEELVEKGDLTPGQARNHPRRNLITRALGTDPTVEADGFHLQWKKGEFLLLCSDGLVNTVTDQEILFEISHNGQPEDCLQRLIAISKERGAPDNVTAILLMND